MIRRRYSLQGQVQGINLRWQVKTKAEQLKISGWVHNELNSTSVTLVVQGPAEVIQVFDGWLRRDIKLANLKSVKFINEVVIKEPDFFIII
ncbi:acylphosphatase [Patescibacteria group bacterium]|nr:acylphosphatase [Patescibacteria group bacterium]